jgi:hypothetical protein
MSLVLPVIAFALILGGAFGGAFLRRVLPDRHLADSAKDFIRLGSGLIATISALVLGLLISSAKSSYDVQSGQVRQLTAQIILVDSLLARYGPETREARELIRRSIAPLVDQIWRSTETTTQTPFHASEEAEAAYAKLIELAPQNDAQRLLKARMIQAITDIAQTRLLLFEQSQASIPMPFLAVLVLWLAIIFASFSLFSDLNPTIIAAMVIFALSASAAIFLILQLSQPFAGLMQLSSTPLTNALATLTL